MKEKERTPIKRRKTSPVMVEQQGVQAQERKQEVVGTRSKFRIVTIDGGKTLNIQLPIPRLVRPYIRAEEIAANISTHVAYIP